MVVLLDEGVEASLLSPHGGCGRSCGTLFEGFVHPLMPAVLLGAPRFDQLGINTEADPPDRQFGEPAQGSGGKGCTVVGTDDVGQSILLECAAKHCPGVLVAGADKCLTAEEEAAVAVRYGEGIAILPVSCFKLTFEVGGPEGIGRVHGRVRPTGVSWTATAAAVGNKAVSLEDACDSALGRPVPVGEAVSEELEQLLGAVERVLLSGFDDGVNKEVSGFVGTVPGAPGAIPEPHSSLGFIPRDPLVPGLAADPVAGAKLGKSEDFSEAISNE
jgi:hypothetical protein